MRELSQQNGEEQKKTLTIKPANSQPSHSQTLAHTHIKHINISQKGKIVSAISFYLKTDVGASEMAQPIKVAAAYPDDPNCLQDLCGRREITG